MLIGATPRYASLANALDLVRKALGKPEIATVQTAWIDQQAGLIRARPFLRSDWPVCPVGEIAAPARGGSAHLCPTKVQIRHCGDSIDALVVTPSSALSRNCLSTATAQRYDNGCKKQKRT